MSVCDRELNDHFKVYSDALLKYHAPDALHDTTPSHIRPKNSLVSGFPTDPSKLMRKSFFFFVFFSLWAKNIFFCLPTHVLRGQKKKKKKKNTNHRPTASPTSCRKDEKWTFWYVLCHLFDRASTSDTFLSCVHSLPTWFLSSVVDINMIIF